MAKDTSSRDQAMAKYVRDSAYVWHNMMGGGTAQAFKKMLSGGLTDHYIENDNGFKEFINAVDGLDKVRVIQKYRKKDQGWEYASSEEEMLERLKTHGLAR